MLDELVNKPKAVLKALKAAKDTKVLEKLEPFPKTAISHGRRWQIFYNARKGLRFELPENKATEAFLADFHKGGSSMVKFIVVNMDFERSVRSLTLISTTLRWRNYYRVAL
ncbi:hypothetical protein SPFM20_00202 [Salmonella phage SPFM20]|nr:hypothetical protein SPFM20_00202 [Salmonella phage SPFM20]